VPPRRAVAFVGEMADDDQVPGDETRVGQVRPVPSPEPSSTAITSNETAPGARSLGSAEVLQGCAFFVIGKTTETRIGAYPPPSSSASGRSSGSFVLGPSSPHFRSSPARFNQRRSTGRLSACVRDRGFPGRQRPAGGPASGRRSPVFQTAALSPAPARLRAPSPTGATRRKRTSTACWAAILSWLSGSVHSRLAAVTDLNRKTR
jgi:hypothetical protein